MIRLLYVCEADTGGIMEYALRQAAALMGVSGIDFVFACRPTFPVARLPAGIRIETLPAARLRVSPRRSGILSRLGRSIATIRDLRRLWECVADLADRGGARLNHESQKEPSGSHGEVRILFACYQEYFAPFWVGPLQELAKRGVAIGTIAHDPVRDFVVGPLWWHRWSVRLGYSFVRHVFVHDNTPIDFGGSAPTGIEVHEIPHGPYEIARPQFVRSVIRSRYGFKEDCADMVFLAFGQIRDGKNLDLFIRAMAKLPSWVKLLVAGEGVSGTSKPPAYYKRLAFELGVADRCAWDIRRIPDEEVGDLFEASDAILLTYNSQFRSASGVLNAAVSAQKPVFASSGPGPLKNAVQEYMLGVWVEPDNEDAILAGFEQLQCNPPLPRWADYTRNNSWERNAELVVHALSEGS